MTPDRAFTLLSPAELSDSVPYAYASSVPAGTTLVYAAGACPLDEQGETVAPGDFAGQAEHVMSNLAAALAAGGATLGDVVKSTVYVASQHRRDLVTVWEVVRAAFGEQDPPSTLLGVAVLGYPDQLVEVEAIAAVRRGDAGPGPGDRAGA